METPSYGTASSNGSAAEPFTRRSAVREKLDIEQGHEPETSTSRHWTAKIPGLLRGLGAAALLVSLYVFLVKGWEGSSDLLRYVLLLGHTVLLSVIALASGHYLNEGKGPRILMMLSLVSVAVNFAVLGAFVFAGTSVAAQTFYPSYLTWSVGGLATALSVTLAGALCLLPVVWFGFRTLARALSPMLSGLFLLGNLALLLPVRDPVIVATVSGVLALLAVWLAKEAKLQSIESKTFEGRVALAIQFLPVLVLLVRNLWLYSSAASLCAALALLSFVFLRQVALTADKKSTLRSSLNLLSVVPAFCATYFVGEALLVSNLSGSFALLASTSVGAAMLYEISTRSYYHAGLCRVLATGYAVVGLLINLVLFDSAIASLLTLGSGIAGIAFSYRSEQRSVLIGGVVLTLAGLTDQALRIFQVFDFGYWITLAVVGVIAIVLGSVLESKAAGIKRRLHHWKQRYASWSY